MLQLVAPDVGPGESEAGRTGWRKGGGGWRCGQGTEGKREENLVSAFLFLLFNLAGCHTQSTPPPSLHPSIPRSSQSLFVSKATASHVSLTTGPLPIHPPPLPTPLPTISIANAVITTVSQRRGESGRERGKT